MHKTYRLPEVGIEVEIGKYARQADGAVWIKAGNNRVLSTVVAASKPKEFLGFFPLSVEYRERPSAAGRIPGGYIKREGRLSDVEVLTSRLIDRPIRPLFPLYYFNEVQIITTVLSYDGSFPASILGLIASSLALTISSIPFLGPIGAVLVARVEGEWKFNPAQDDIKNSDANIVIAGTECGICMVEGQCDNVQEKDFIDLLERSHVFIKQQIEWQKSIAQDLGIATKDASLGAAEFAPWEQRVASLISKQDLETLWTSSKTEEKKAMAGLQEKVMEAFKDDIEAKLVSSSVISFVLDLYLKKALPDLMVQKKQRMDGRSFDTIRKISGEVGTLPCAHGSSLFQRGDTQALASVTMGTGQDVQRIEDLVSGEREKTFMLHYNFPPYSVGEVRAIRAVGRREIGHGYLAETSFVRVLPSQETFPYTIRAVVDIMESHGSTSMAAVCSTTMALMDAGVPVKQMVSGIAMGLMQDSQKQYHVFTDINGTEDAFGLMDFKVTGTESGIMAFQLDIKDKVGLSREVLAKALEQARVARLFILDEMKKVIKVSREELAPTVPRITTLKVPTDKIGIIIGPGGSTIKEIVAETGAQIDIEDDGTVKIFAKDAESAKDAEGWIRNLTKVVEVGESYTGFVRRITNFGVFVELFPGKDGLVHIATIAKSKQPYLEKLYKMGDKITVVVTAIDAQGKIRLSSADLSKS